MSDPKTYKFNTKTLHSGHQPDKNFGSRAVPIYQTTSYLFQDADHAAALFNLEEGGHIYSRISNPTISVLEERVAALEGGSAALATASGMSAMMLALLNICSAGDHIVSSSQLYGGSFNLLRLTLKRFGIETTFVKPRDTEGFKKAIQPNTKCIWGGADIITHSLTKWMAGHGTSMGGIIVEKGDFDWTKGDKFPTMTEPYDGYHGLSFAEEFGPAAFTMRARAEGMRDFGPCMSPTNAFNILIGIETLSVRMEKHLSNTKIMVDYLSNNPSVSWVNHPSLPDHPDHKVAAKLMPKGAGSMIAFGIKGGKEAGHAFINSLKLTSHLANVGDAKSLVIHPASATHSQMDKKSLELAGLTEDMIRFSVGLEDMDDIINDFENGFRASQKPRLVASK